MAQPLDMTFPIDIVGGETIQVPFVVQTKIPEIEILEKVLDFGTIQLGNRKKIDMTIVNKSKLEAILILDLRPDGKNEDIYGLEGLDIEYVL